MMVLAPNIAGQPHPWAEAIAAWARGELVQWRFISSEATDADWRDCDFPSRGRPNFECEHFEFRVAALAAAEAQPVPVAGVAEPLPGWKLNHARRHPDPDQDGAWEIGFLDDEDDRFSPILTVDTGLYYQDEHAEPLAKAILAMLLAAAPAAPAVQPPVRVFLDHQIAHIVNGLTGIAKEHGASEQLRHHIREFIEPVLACAHTAGTAAPPESDGPGHPFAWLEPELSTAGHTHWAMTVREMRAQLIQSLRGERWHAERQRELQGNLAKIRDAITDYHKALDNRQHGGVAQDKAMHAIEAVVGMPWVQGATLTKPAQAGDVNEGGRV